MFRKSHAQSIEGGLEYQYDANNDYAIFGMGNDKLGGIQTMQEKMNMADKPDDVNSSEDSGTDREHHSTSVIKPGSKGSNERSTVAGSMPMDSEKSSPKNQLPEDKEIHSDVE